MYIYKGILEFYFETGYEQLAVIFSDDSGICGEKGQYRSLDAAIFLGKKDTYHIKVFNTDDSMAYEGTLTYDPEKVIASNYKVSFFPKELDVKTWVSFCQRELRAELTTNKRL